MSTDSRDREDDDYESSGSEYSEDEEGESGEANDDGEAVKGGLEQKIWTNKELQEVELCENEKKEVYYKKFQPLSAFYPVLGLRDTFKYQLWKFCIKEFIIVVVFKIVVKNLFCFVMNFWCLACFPLLCTLFPLCCGFCSPCLWVCCNTKVFPMLERIFVEKMKEDALSRISYVQEHRMRGSIESLEMASSVKSGYKFAEYITPTISNSPIGIGNKCWIFTENAMKTLSDVCFVAGSSLCPCFSTCFLIFPFFTRSWLHGSETFENGYLSRKYLLKSDRCLFKLRHFVPICFFGMGSFLMTLLTCGVFDFFSIVGATKLGEHIVHIQREKKKEKVVTKMLKDQILMSQRNNRNIERTSSRQHRPRRRRRRRRRSRRDGSRRSSRRSSRRESTGRRDRRRSRRSDRTRV